jgi:hypothetical protein
MEHIRYNRGFLQSELLVEKLLEAWFWNDVAGID